MLLTQAQLAADWDRSKVKFPVMAQPKGDGVRALNLFGSMTGRSLKKFGNRFATAFFSQGAFLGIDGEMAAESLDNLLLCTLTTSALGTHQGEPWLLWWAFDYLRPETIELQYQERYRKLQEVVMRIKETHHELGRHVNVMPSVWCSDMNELEFQINHHSSCNYEGTIIRDPYGKHKNGRSSPTHGGLLRIKNFIEVDCIVDDLVEGQTNLNEAKTNALGLTERSTHKANMVSSGRVGAVLATLLEDAKHPFTGKVLHTKGEKMRFGAGKMSHAERELYLKRPELIVGKRMKGRIFPIGIKDKPRFPTFQSLRDIADTVDE